MYKIILSGVFKFVSILIIFFTVLLFITLNALVDDIGLKSNNTSTRKNYELSTAPAYRTIPEFIYNLESIFSRHLIPVIVKIKSVSETNPPETPPLLKFVGMIETDKKIIYSFRNMDTNKLLLFEKGVFIEGIILVSVEVTKYTFRKNETTFQVDKK